MKELVENQYIAGPLIITSQVSVDKWYELIQEKNLAVAIIERIIYKAHSIELEGESIHKKEGKGLSV